MTERQTINYLVNSYWLLTIVIVIDCLLKSKNFQIDVSLLVLGQNSVLSGVRHHVTNRTYSGQLTINDYMVIL